MSVPSQTIIHAACNVDGTTPEFPGTGNEGFLPFGPDDASHSARVSPGVYHMRMVQPIDIDDGAGGYVVEPMTSDFTLEIRAVNASTTTINVLIQRSGVPDDDYFCLVVYRFPQSLQG